MGYVASIPMHPTREYVRVQNRRYFCAEAESEVDAVQRPFEHMCALAVKMIVE
jgi:hypothetical protein